MNRNVIRSIARTGFAVAVLPAVLAFLIQSGAYAQSTDQNYPTPATAPEIVGVIKARDIGDSRLTTYYYLINADNGDLFLNVLTKNFSGDIDLFTLPNLQPMSKIVIYADLPENETGRVV